MNTPPVLGMILKGYPRISETFISNEILLLETLGIHIHIISMRQPRESFSHASIRQIRARVDYLPEALTLASLPVLLSFNLQLAIKRPNACSTALKAALRRFRRTRKVATFKHLLQAGYLVEKILPGSGITHFHAHFAHSPTSVAFYASLLSGVPFSFTAHAKDIYTSHPEQLQEKMRYARFVITCTEYNRQYLAGLANSPTPPIYRVYHGIDTRLFSGWSQNTAPAPPYRILTISRLTAKKGLPTVFKALGMLRDRGIPFRHTLIGDGDDSESLRRLVQVLHLETLTAWKGTLPHGAVVRQFRDADIFVLGCEIAANGDRDGIPNVCVESMAMGVPVVATTVSAIPELIESEKTGLLVEPGNPGALADAMLRLLTDHDLRTRIIPAAARQVQENFDNRRLIQWPAALYQAALTATSG